MNISGVLLLFIAAFLTASPLMAQMDDQQPVAMMNNEELPVSDDMVVEAEGYDSTDQEYNDAEVNAEIPDEYFNDDALTNEEVEPVADNVESTVTNVEAVQ